jgi:hypothetical protein
VAFLDDIKNTDEPFSHSHGLNFNIVYEAARKKGCIILMYGIAGDLLSYSPADL